MDPDLRLTMYPAARLVAFVETFFSSLGAMTFIFLPIILGYFVERKEDEGINEDFKKVGIALFGHTAVELIVESKLLMFVFFGFFVFFSILYVQMSICLFNATSEPSTMGQICKAEGLKNWLIFNQFIVLFMCLGFILKYYDFALLDLAFLKIWNAIFSPFWWKTLFVRCSFHVSVALYKMQINEQLQET